MTGKKTLMLLRHGRTSNTAGKRFIGRTNVSIAVEGHREIEDLAPYIRAGKPERCLCSPLLRAQQTAEIVAGAAGLSVEVAPELREIDFGRWEGMSFEEVAASDPELVNRWAAWEEDFAFPEGEPLRGFFNRVKRGADRMLADSAQRILAVTHGGVIRAMICHLLGLHPRQYLLFDVKPASLTTIDVFDGRGVLTGLNIGPHMERPKDGPNHPDNRRRQER